MAASSAITQAHLDALEQAIATGATFVEYEDKKIRYRDLDEMERVADRLRCVLTPTGGGPPAGSIRLIYAEFSKDV